MFVRVVVIGAGVIGSAVADAMARRKADVTVLDMRGPGRGASQASAGILAPYTEAERDSPLLALGRRSLDMFDDFIDGVRDRSGRPVEYARSGTLEVALDESDRERLETAGQWLASAGVAAQWLDASAVRQFEPTVSDEALGGLFVERHGFLNVPALVDALVHSARFAGASFESMAEAAVVSPSKNGVEVRSGDRRWSADAAVLAAGTWSGRVKVDGARSVRVRPVRGQLLHLGWRDGQPPSRVVWGPGCYTVPWTDGTLLVGATVEEAGFDETSTVAGVRSLASSVERLLPRASNASLREIRVGLRPAMADGLPAVGPLAEHVTAATGHYRNGILLTPLTADVVARLVLDRDSDPMLSATDPARAGLDG